MILKNCIYYDDKTDKICKGNIYIENGKIIKKEILKKISQNKLFEYFETNLLLNRKIDNNKKKFDSQNLKKLKISFTNNINDNFKNITEIENKEKLDNTNIIIDCDEHLIIPAGIDPHVHFDTPGYTHREDFEHGTASAAAGGITTIIDMPCTSIPEVVSKENFEKKLSIVSSLAHIDFSFFGGIHGNMFNENLEKHVKELVDLKVKGFKVYSISGMKTFPRVTNYQFFEAVKLLKDYNVPILLHAEDYELVNGLTKKEKAAGKNYINYFNSRPALAEILAVGNALEIVKSLKGDLHIVHVASYDAALKIKMYKNEGINVTSETCPQYIYFTYKDFENKGSSLKTAPVVKTEYDRTGLKQLLFNEDIDFISSDHAPAPLYEKNTGSIWTDYGGIPGTQTIIPVLLTIGLNSKKIDLKSFIHITSENAAKRYNIFPEKGSLKEGTDADIAIINPIEEWVFSKEELLSKGETTPFDGEKFKGKVKITINRGKIVYSDYFGLISKKGDGKYY